MTRTLGAIAVASLLTLLVALPTLAHAELEESDPADGETIQTPYRLTATFSEEFDPDTDASFIRVQDAAGDVVASGGHDDEPMTMAVDVPLLPPGEYTVRWQTTTPDDNGVERGTFTFTVEASPTPAPTPRPTESPDASATPAPTASPSTTPTPSPAPTASPAGPSGPSTGGSNDVLLALAIGVAIIGALAFFLVRRSRP